METTTRFTELETDRRAKCVELSEAEANPPTRDHQVDLLHKIPMLQSRLAELRDAHQRKLFAAFHLEVRYNDTTQVALLRGSLDAETIEEVAAMSEHIPGNHNSRPQVADGCAVDSLRAPGVTVVRRGLGPASS
ncbi:hypothetical protein ACIBG8_08340 [Nonomuraea sp. NPDC050556]|uniref:hypothetical protein n=1 Tax=Nonomuraea sp. NPDC050556 TaxID=3364369 RepID=UPI0037B454F5